MRLLALTLLLGDLCFQQLAALPSFGWQAPLIVSAVFYIFLKSARPLAGLALGFFLAHAHAQALLFPALDPALEGRDVTLVGRITGLPDRDAERTGFVLALERLELEGRAVAAPVVRVRLSWYGPAPPLVPGERWRLPARLKHPHGFMNPGGFDYEAWLFQQGIRATGYVRSEPAPQRLDAEWAPIDGLRQEIAAGIAESLGADGNAGTIAALSVGDRSGLSSAQWDLLSASGTSHLMAISGLHIGLIAGLCFAAVGRLWRHIPGASLRLAAPRAAALAALAAAAGYAALAGFTVPTQRALVMLTVALGAVLLARPVRAGHGLALALVAVLLLDPLAILSPGFWLSFVAVAVILYAVVGRLHRARGAWAWGRVQLVIALALSLPLLWFFQRTPLISPLANAVLVPWVGLVVVPLSLLGALLVPVAPGLAHAPLVLADLALAAVWPLLEALTALPGAEWVQARPPAWALLPAGLGVALLLAPRGWPGRPVGLVLLAPLLLHRPQGPGVGEAWLTVLDVGQGLAAVVETRRHVLVFDAGPWISGEFDAGEAAVVPFLQSRGRSRLDVLVVSHGDIDHSGGVGSVLRGLQVGEVLVGPGVHPGHGGRACRRGQGWQWDGVEVDVLHPAPGFEGSDNDGSCVLRVRAGGQAALLVADLERGGEAALLAQQVDSLAADVLLVPHHGSRSSSTTALLDAVAPRVAVVSAGYRNRFGFPKPDVMERYASRGVTLLNTAQDGAVSLRLGGSAGFELAPGARVVQARYWHHRPRL